MADAVKEDLGPVRWESLSWEDGKVASSLDSMYERAVAQANEAINWYLASLQTKKRWARGLRGWAMFFGAMAGVIPMLSQMAVLSKDGHPVVEPGWSAVALAIAAALVLVDRFYGYSTGWMRYIAAELKLQQMTQEFQMDWETCKLGWQGAEPSADCRQTALAMIKGFVTQVNTVVRQETDAWIQEFQSVLAQIDESTKAKPVANELGAVNVEVCNGDACDTGWKIAIDGGSYVDCRGKNTGFCNIVPGVHTIKVVGVIAGNPKEAQKVASVSAGGVAEVQLTLN